MFSFRPIMMRPQKVLARSVGRYKDKYAPRMTIHVRTCLHFVTSNSLASEFTYNVLRSIAHCCKFTSSMLFFPSQLLAVPEVGLPANYNSLLYPTEISYPCRGEQAGLSTTASSCKRTGAFGGKKNGGPRCNSIRQLRTSDRTWQGQSLYRP